MPLFRTHRIGKENIADEDHALVKRLRSGDDFALNEIMQRYKERVFRLAWRYVGNEDAALDVSRRPSRSFISSSTNTTPPINSAPAVHHFGEGIGGAHSGIRNLFPEKRIDERERHQLDQYLEAVLEKVKTADDLYVFGPAETRVALQRKIETDKSYKDLLPRLRAVEPADNMTKKQIVARVKEFFSK